ncbi:MAG TPA: hypothetical protein PLK67_12740 [Bryobacteraceae bacterium]|nr:hypothetical protein [Bryobacteraceae bacterium]
MRWAQDCRLEKSLLLVCLLLLAQWTGFYMVLCVSGPDHVQTEVFDARCTSSPPSDAEGIVGAGGRCTGCTDMPVQTAYGWDASRRETGDNVLTSLPAESPGGLVRPAVSETAFDAVRSPLASSRLATAVPLRC